MKSLLWTILIIVITHSADAEWRTRQVYSGAIVAEEPPFNAINGQRFCMDDDMYNTALSEIGKSAVASGQKKYEGSLSTIHVRFVNNNEDQDMNMVICYYQGGGKFWVKKEGSDYVVHYK